jgi:tetratricopeptide (TPR) repeat protein
VGPSLRRLLLVLALGLLWPQVAPAQPRVSGVLPAAQPHLQRALRHFEAKDYPKALVEFRAAYTIDPQPSLLYAIAQAERMNGDCRRAIRYYEAYLRTAPNELQARLARENIARCTEELRRSPPTSQPASAPVDIAPPPVTPPPAPVRAERVPWRSNWLGHGLTLGGLAVAATGVALWSVAHGALTAPNGAGDYGTFAARVRDAANAGTWQRVGVAAMSVGGALVVAGILTYALRARRPVERPIVTTLVAPGTAVLVVAAPW